MTEIVEEAAKLFNVYQRTSRSIEKTFCHGGKDLWKDYKVEFKAHLDALSGLSLYSNKIKSRTDGRLPADDGVLFNN